MQIYSILLLIYITLKYQIYLNTAIPKCILVVDLNVEVFDVYDTIYMLKASRFLTDSTTY